MRRNASPRTAVTLLDAHYVDIMRRLSPLLIVLAAALAVSAAARADVPAGAPVDGIRCDQMEGAVLHIHQHVAVRDHGRAVAIPPDVGRPLLGQCFYWIHTHTPDGIVHVESPSFRTFTLGEFFDVWGQPLTAHDVAGARTRKNEHVAVWVDGAPFRGDPRTIPLTQHLDVTFEVGPPYTKPKPFTEWNGN